jgi:hypothetical protein
MAALRLIANRGDEIFKQRAFAIGNVAVISDAAVHQSNNNRPHFAQEKSANVRADPPDKQPVT